MSTNDIIAVYSDGVDHQAYRQGHLLTSHAFWIKWSLPTRGFKAKSEIRGEHPTQGSSTMDFTIFLFLFFLLAQATFGHSFKFA